jgi:hypothetical protein
MRLSGPGRDRRQRPSQGQIAWATERCRAGREAGANRFPRFCGKPPERFTLAKPEGENGMDAGLRPKGGGRMPL